MFRESHRVGNTVALPVDTSTRAFRRACSEPRFHFERIERDKVVLKDTAIQFRWPSGRGSEPCEPDRTGAQSLRNSPKRGGPEGGPHNWGFGLIPAVRHGRFAPTCTARAGILGSMSTGTRVVDLEVEDDTQSHGEVESLDSNFPRLNQTGRDEIPKLLPTPTPKPRFPNLSKFLGYFRPNVKNKVRRSYAQVVRAESVPIAMVSCEKPWWRARWIRSRPIWKRSW